MTSLISAHWSDIDPDEFIQWYFHFLRKPSSHICGRVQFSQRWRNAVNLKRTAEIVAPTWAKGKWLPGYGLVQGALAPLCFYNFLFFFLHFIPTWGGRKKKHIHPVLSFPWCCCITGSLNVGNGNVAAAAREDGWHQWRTGLVEVACWRGSTAHPTPAGWRWTGVFTPLQQAPAWCSCSHDCARFDASKCWWRGRCRKICSPITFAEDIVNQVAASSNSLVSNLQ